MSYSQPRVVFDCIQLKTMLTNTQIRRDTDCDTVRDTQIGCTMITLMTTIAHETAHHLKKRFYQYPKQSETYKCYRAVDKHTILRRDRDCETGSNSQIGWHIDHNDDYNQP